ncbi:MAG: InlB B-repeat-containing protein [Clostridia bacterium]|nr:InlB B-repeat-containing protein [Clostridia bacterium]
MKKRILSMFLAVMMLVSVFPTTIIAADGTAAAALTPPAMLENTNQASGVVLRKGVSPHTVNGVPDGTADVTIEAYTTSKVTQTTASIPTDIVLVLDVSGSMDDSSTATTTTTTTYDAANATYFRRRVNSRYVYYYGFNTTYNTYYINIGTAAVPHYVEVEYEGYDENNFYYYHYYDANDEKAYVYPQTANTPSATREFNYPVMQFYAQTVHTNTVYAIEALKTAVDAFIESTHQKNAELTKNGQTELHRIAIVKFAGPQYYDSSNLLAEGDHMYTEYYNSYNYTEVVKNFTVVDAAGDEELTNAVNSLRVGGATAIDYGMSLASQLLAQDPPSSAQRNKVVIVFSDGSPTHGNTFETSVANAAIATAKNIKFTGTTVYSISVAPDAETSDTNSNNNKFFHYVSSNYPNASSMSNEGANGSTAGGYYLTPTSSQSLAMIFQSIAHNIENTAIELGESAQVVDTMSAYFSIPAGASSVTLQTADRIKNADGTWGWDDPDDASGVSAVVQDETVAIRGFNYDENYLSENPRTKGANTEYYGTKLIITINVTPDYNAIDTHMSQLTDGYIPSNDGTANLLNSKAEKIATVDTPYLPTNTVTYQYTDPVSGSTVSYKQFYRLPGASLTTITDTPAIAGYKFTGWATGDATVDADGNYTMPEGDVVFTGRFTPNTHNVTYTITGYNPGATEPADLTGVAFATEVTVAADLTYPGYTFTGWFTQDAFVKENDATFIMPDSDVDLVGYFTANSGIPYKTIHYTENLDGTFSPVETVNATGTTDATVTAAVRAYEGFTLTDVKDVTVVTDGGITTLSTVSSGKVTADGQFTMHQFHKRNAYNVTYKYEGTVIPADATDLTSYAEADVPYETSVTVKPDASAQGYTFSGWRIESPANTVIANGAFTMPASDVVLVGSFTAKTNTEYTVEYYWQNITDDGYTLHESVTHHDGVTDQDVSAPQKSYTGFTLNLNAPDTVASGKVKADGSLVLKLYYDRNTYNVTYKYEGTVPSDATDLSTYAKTGVRYGTTVNVERDATAVGYTFSGWRIESPASTVINAGTFTMPASDVVLVGEFAASTSTKYTVEYYWQNITDDGYTLHETETHYNGVTDQTVDAPQNIYTGLTLNLNAPGTVASGTVKADGSLVLKLYYDRNTYNVTYRYEGTVPADATDLSRYSETGIRFGASVNVKPDASAPGYAFSGWEIESPAGLDAAGGAFTMPADDVVLVGSFTARTNIEYKVEYYWQNLDGNGYTFHEDDIYKNGVTDQTVHALQKTYTGLTLNLNAPGTLASGKVKADGSLVLKLYYDRVLYNVTYEYEGTIPSDATALPSASTAYYTNTVTVAPNATAKGYTFSGWSIKSPAGITLHSSGADTVFTMPASDVVLVGTFVLDPTYYVEYYLEQPDGSYKKDEDASHSHTAPIGTNVSAHARVYTGYTENTTHPDRKISGVVPADQTLVLKLYYDLIEYTVTYVYEGTVPAGAPALPAVAVKYYKDTVTTPAVELEGYTFEGWTSAQVGNVAHGKTFTMPNANVVLKGKFIAGEAIYKIEHYLMNDAGTYDGVAPHVESKTGIVGNAVRATTYKPYLDLGAKVDTDKTYTDGKWEGIVLPSRTNPLVLKVYYSREPAARVTYHYEGDLTETEWRALGWPDLPTDSAKYYVGAKVTAKNFDTAMSSNWVFEGWYASDPTIHVLPDGTFTMPRLPGTNPEVKFYGRWIDTTPKTFTVKYFVDGMELTQYTQTYTVDTPVTVMAKIADTEERTYSDWSAPESATAGATVVTNADGSFTMSVPGEVHIKCTSTLLPPKTYTVTYFLNAQQYAQYTYAAGETHTILDAPLTMTGQEFTGWSAPVTTTGATVSLSQSGGKYVFTMPAADVEIYGSLFWLPEPDCELIINKVVDAPENFTGTGVYSFNVYSVDGGVKTLVHTVHIAVNKATGKGSAPAIKLESGVSYVIEEVGAAIPGYSLKTLLTNADGTALTLGEALKFKGLYTGPNEITFTNIYDELALDTHNHFGYIIGYPDETVRPNDYLSRAEAVTIFFRLLTDAKRAEYWSKTNPFTDVAADAWYNNAISTLYNAGVLSGYQDNTFRPDDPITRAELVKIAMSFYGTPVSSNDALFDDIGTHWALSFINAAAEIGFVDGDGDGTFDPDRYVTRAEAMKIINRTLVRHPHKDYLLTGMIYWSDNMDTSAWYYAEVQEATNSHTYMYTSAHEIWEAILPVRDWEALEKTWSDANSGKE